MAVNKGFGLNREGRVKSELHSPFCGHFGVIYVTMSIRGSGNGTQNRNEEIV